MIYRQLLAGANMGYRQVDAARVALLSCGAGGQMWGVGHSIPPGQMLVGISWSRWHNPNISSRQLKAQTITTSVEIDGLKFGIVSGLYNCCSCDFL